MKLTHVDKSGKARMVDTSSKPALARTARAEGWLRVSAATPEVIEKAGLPKGNPFEVARLAGIQAAKLTGTTIPLCHPIPLDFADVEIDLEPSGFHVRSEVRCRGATGVEMEALTAVTMAALTLYDMCKAIDKEMVIEGVKLLSKSKESMQ